VLSMSPLRIAAIKEDDVSARIPAAAMPEEIVPLVERLNELLHRLDEAFARERCLTADIAHELRTPVAGVLSTAGVALSADREPADYREALEDVRRIARRMRSMIENLLAVVRVCSRPCRILRRARRLNRQAGGMVHLAADRGIAELPLHRQYAFLGKVWHANCFTRHGFASGPAFNTGERR